MGSSFEIEVAIVSNTSDRVVINPSARDLVPERYWSHIGSTMQTNKEGLLKAEYNDQEIFTGLYLESGKANNMGYFLAEDFQHKQVFIKKMRDSQYGEENYHIFYAFKDKDGNNIGFSYANQSDIKGNTVTFRFVPYNESSLSKAQEDFEADVNRIYTQLSSVTWIDSSNTVREGETSFISLPGNASNYGFIPVRSYGERDLSSLIRSYAFNEFVLGRNTIDEIYEVNLKESSIPDDSMVAISDGYREIAGMTFDFFIIVDMTNGEPVACGFIE